MSQYVAEWRDGFQVVWRNLTWKEYQSFKTRYESSPFAEPMDVALDIYRTVYIKGPDPKFAPAGIPGFICKQQMANNPFSGRYEDIAPAVEIARRVVTGDYMMCAKAIIAATLNYRPEEIDTWDPTTFFLRLAQAEIANGRTFDPINPKAPKDAHGNPLPLKKQHKPLSPAQQKAIDRSREDRSRG